MAAHLLSIHEEEFSRRQDFSSVFENHFLNALFSGLDDMPPPFAIRAPNTFDEGLANLGQGDLDTLTATIPDIVSKLALPDLREAIDFFSTRCVNRNKMEGDLKLRPLDIHSHLKE